MTASETARWLDGRKHEDIQVFVRQHSSDLFQVDSQDNEGNRGSVLFPAWKIEQLARIFGLKDQTKKPERWADRRAMYVALCNGARVPDYPESCKLLTPIPGRVHVWMYEPEFSDGGIKLTDRTGSRPEVGRIVGGDQDGLLVAVRPYAGYWIPGPWGEIRVYGVMDDIEDVILMRWVPGVDAPGKGDFGHGDGLLFKGGWMPSHDWLVVDREPLNFLQKDKFKRQGVVKMAGPDASAKVGDKCAWGLDEEKERRGFVLRLEEWGSRTGSFFGPETVLVWDGCAPSWSTT